MRPSFEMILLLGLGPAVFSGLAQQPGASGASLATQDRMSDAPWWPTKGDAPRHDYVGADTCKECHGKIAASQAQTPMFHAAVRALNADVFSSHDQLAFSQNDLSYALVRSPGQVTFSVSDATNKSAQKIVWAFGTGVYGQTYILQQDGRFTESRLSYFTHLGGLDTTPGQGSITPHSLDDALGKQLDTDTAQKCFGCHTTVARVSNLLDSEKAIPGVTCESCHGPGAKHVGIVRGQASTRGSLAIVNPAHLSPSDSVDFCGACHRTWTDVAMEMPANIGAAAVRFQPYRLEMSRCWGRKGDARITCIACHDPHQPLVHEPAAYDSKCLACHSTSPIAKNHAVVKMCKVATADCVSCHMPKVAVPETHATFTDHNIRIVRGS